MSGEHGHHGTPAPFVFCVATAIIFHSDFSDQMQFISFMKNIGLAGGFLFIVVNGAKDFSLDKKLGN